MSGRNGGRTLGSISLANISRRERRMRLKTIQTRATPYENEHKNMVKPHGFVLDFVGIFENLEKALAFDSDEVNAIVKDINLLKQLFKSKICE